MLRDNFVLNFILFSIRPPTRPPIFNAPVKIISAISQPASYSRPRNKRQPEKTQISINIRQTLRALIIRPLPPGIGPGMNQRQRRFIPEILGNIIFSQFRPRYRPKIRAVKRYTDESLIRNIILKHDKTSFLFNKYQYKQTAEYIEAIFRPPLRTTGPATRRIIRSSSRTRRHSRPALLRLRSTIRNQLEYKIR